MLSSDSPEKKGFRILFGACSECNVPLYYPPVRVPSLVGMRWDPVDPTRAMAEMKNVCIKKKCQKKALTKYREELEQGEITIDGARPVPHRRSAPADPEEHPQEDDNG